MPYPEYYGPTESEAPKPKTRMGGIGFKYPYTVRDKAYNLLLELTDRQKIMKRYGCGGINESEVELKALLQEVLDERV